MFLENCILKYLKQCLLRGDERLLPSINVKTSEVRHENAKPRIRTEMFNVTNQDLRPNDTTLGIISRLSYKEHGADALALRAEEGRDKLR